VALEIVNYGDPRLRQIARPMEREEILDPRMQRLAIEMGDVMRAGNGIGLAAPQVGYGIRMIVVEIRPEQIAQIPEQRRIEREITVVPFQTHFNPSYDVLDATQRCYIEGCISYPRFMGPVKRFWKILVRSQDERGEERPPFVATGLLAAAIQHEIDHLEGILYIDLVPPGMLLPMAEAREKYGSLTSDELMDLITSRSPEARASSIPPTQPTGSRPDAARMDSEN
jgi:peptide deformylase